MEAAALVGWLPQVPSRVALLRCPQAWRGDREPLPRLLQNALSGAAVGCEPGVSAEGSVRETAAAGASPRLGWGHWEQPPARRGPLCSQCLHSSSEAEGCGRCSGDSHQEFCILLEKASRALAHLLPPETQRAG